MGGGEGGTLLTTGKESLRPAGGPAAADILQALIQDPGGKALPHSVADRAGADGQSRPQRRFRQRRTAYRMVVP